MPMYKKVTYYDDPGRLLTTVQRLETKLKNGYPIIIRKTTFTRPNARLTKAELAIQKELKEKAKTEKGNETEGVKKNKRGRPPKKAAKKRKTGTVAKPRDEEEEEEEDAVVLLFSSSSSS